MAVLPDKRVWILTGRKYRYVDFKPLSDKHFAGFGRSTLTGGVGVEAQNDLAREPAQLLGLGGCQGGTARSDYGLKPGLIHLGEVEIAFDQHGHVSLPNGRLAQIQSIKCPTLRVDRRFRGIQIL